MSAVCQTYTNVCENLSYKSLSEQTTSITPAYRQNVLRYFLVPCVIGKVSGLQLKGCSEHRLIQPPLLVPFT